MKVQIQMDLTDEQAERLRFLVDEAAHELHEEGEDADRDLLELLAEGIEYRGKEVV